MEDGTLLPVLVEDRKGYENLCSLLTQAHLRSEKGTCLVRYGELAEFSAGLIALFSATVHQSALGSAHVSRAGDGVPPSRTLRESTPMAGAQYRCRRLPHFEKPWAIYAVTIGTKARRCLSPAARSIVLNALLHFHNQRYELFAACIMPDHVHLLIQPWPKGEDEKGNVLFWSLNELLPSVKSFSARQINKLEVTTGGVWEREQFDRYIRSDRDLEEKFLYIARNPWDSEIVRQDEDYPWVWTQESRNSTESSSRWNSATGRRDACATRTE
jgi:REP element-mobilizing transposase RayT